MTMIKNWQQQKQRLPMTFNFPSLLYDPPSTHMVLSIRLPVSPSHSDLPRMDDGRNCKNGGNISTHHTCN